MWYPDRGGILLEETFDPLYNMWTKDPNHDKFRILNKKKPIKNTDKFGKGILSKTEISLPVSSKQVLYITW